MVYSRERQSFHGNSSAVFIVQTGLKASSSYHLCIITVFMALAKQQLNVASNIS